MTTNLPKPGVYWFHLDGCRLGRLSYVTRRKKPVSAVIETLAGKEKTTLTSLTARVGRGSIAPLDVDMEQSRRFEELLDGQGNSNGG